jgi:hypothetical protein
MADRNAITQPQAGPEGFYRTMKAYGCASLAIVAADLVTANTVQLFTVPRGFVPVRLFASASDMDSNGSPTLTISLGDTASAARLLSASTIGQAGTTTSTIVAAAIGVKYAADTQIQATFATGSATAVAGTLTVILEGYMDIG